MFPSVFVSTRLGNVLFPIVFVSRRLAAQYVRLNLLPGGTVDPCLQFQEKALQNWIQGEMWKVSLENTVVSKMHQQLKVKAYTFTNSTK